MPAQWGFQFEFNKGRWGGLPGEWESRRSTEEQSLLQIPPSYAVSAAAAQLPTALLRLRFDDIAHKATTSFLESTEKKLPK